VVAVLLLLAAVATAGGGPATADTRAERDRVRKQRAEIAAQLNVLQAEDAEVEKALADIEQELAAQQVRVSGAEQAAVVAEAALAAAQAAEAALSTRLEGLETSIRVAAIDSYVSRQPSSAPSLETSTDLSEAARRRTLTDLVAKSADDLADELAATKDDLGQARRQATEAAAAAAQRRDEAAAGLAELASARSRQAEFAVRLDARIEKTLAESAGLAQQDEALSAKLTAELAALSRLRRGSGGTSSPRSAGAVTVRTVQGITVNVTIADQVDALLTAAREDGIVLGGGGYRDPEDQHRLRVAHCPDPVSSPASSCRPPTARPGFSMHEQGLAVDFTYQGSVISSRSSPAYRWLAANAGRFGLRNLPSEPWHWSTNGD